VGLDFKVTLPQDEFEELVRYWRDEKGEEHWTVKLKEEFKSCGAIYDDLHHDVLNLSQALK
jgi:hypothetical protein